MLPSISTSKSIPKQIWQGYTNYEHLEPTTSRYQLRISAYLANPMQMMTTLVLTAWMESPHAYIVGSRTNPHRLRETENKLLTSWWARNDIGEGHCHGPS
jgi:hypothetical protein